MTRDEFTRLVETYGATESRWPDEYRAEMIAWRIDNAGAAEAILRSEGDLDKVLESARLEPGTDMLKARILNQIAETSEEPLPVPANNNIARFSQKAVAALMLFAFSVGFAGASFLKLPGSGEEPSYEVASSDWEELAEDYGMDEIYAWVETSPAP